MASSSRSERWSVSDKRVKWTGKDRFLHLTSSLSLIWGRINEISIAIQQQSDLMEKRLTVFWTDFSLTKNGGGTFVLDWYHSI